MEVVPIPNLCWNISFEFKISIGIWTENGCSHAKYYLDYSWSSYLSYLIIFLFVINLWGSDYSDEYQGHHRSFCQTEAQPGISLCIFTSFFLCVLLCLCSKYENNNIILNPVAPLKWLKLKMLLFSMSMFVNYTTKKHLVASL